jgi:hypothetical protein
VCWKDKTCYHCQKKGHPSNHCRQKKGDNDSKKNDDDKSKSSKTSKTSSINKLQKKMKESFAAVENKIQGLEKEDSDITESDDEDHEASHFQCEGNECLMTQIEEVNEIPGVMFQQTFESQNEQIIFKQNHKNKKIDLDLKNVTLLDSQSTVDLFCNPNLVSNVRETDKQMRLKSDGGTMLVNHEATMKGCNSEVWFSNDATTNIVALSNLIKQHQVACDSKDQMFAVHRESECRPNMEFRMHQSGLHCFDPRHKAFVFMNTASGNTEGFSQR